jgi:Fic family protein
VGWGLDDRGDGAAALEAERGLEQARLMSEHIRAALGSPLGFRLTSSLVCAFHEAAMRGLLATAGRLRERSDVEIRGSRHVPPPHEDVGRLLDEFCAFVNDRPDEDPLFIAAYVLWRICWIHPFDDGNGRTARAISYLMLSIRVGVELPGDKPIPLRLKYAPSAYWRALEAADAALASGHPDVGQLQSLLDFYLQAQLRGDPPGLPP